MLIVLLQKYLSKCQPACIKRSAEEDSPTAAVNMVRNTPVIMAMSVLATGAIAAVDYPPIPSDLTTPFQQRLAVYGPNGKTSLPTGDT